MAFPANPTPLQRKIDTNPTRTSDHRVGHAGVAASDRFRIRNVNSSAPGEEVHLHPEVVVTVILARRERGEEQHPGDAGSSTSDHLNHGRTTRSRLATG